MTYINAQSQYHHIISTHSCANTEIEIPKLLVEFKNYFTDDTV